MRIPRPPRSLLAVPSLGLAGLIAGLLAGCATTSSAVPSTATISAQNYAELAGNWQITSAGNTSLSSLGGSLTVSGSTVTGMLHPLAGACVTGAAAAPFAVSGVIDSTGLLSLSSTNFAGGVFHLTGTVAANQHTLQSPAYTVVGGSCSTVAAALASLKPQDTITIAQQYQPISGTYTGNFSDPDGVVMAVSANLQQSASPDANGYYHLSGTATFANNPCLNTPVVTDSVINGATITATYTDSVTGNSITGTGTFDTTATTLTVTNWVLTGSSSCADSGTGSLVK